ncbi:MAG: hypothetical protein IKT08_02225 [Bacteroidales bacterium]|nr:hypothetical protein [Bacteroidales bacterium]
MRRRWVLILLMGFEAMAFGQFEESVPFPSDSLRPYSDSLRVYGNIEFLYQRLFEEAEALADEPDDGEEASDAVEELLIEYEHLRGSPVNLNSEAATKLCELGLLSHFQMESLRQYRRYFGDLLFIEELRMIEAFDEHTIAILAPIVFFGKNDHIMEQERVTLSKAVTKGKHQVTVNMARKFDNSETQEDASDSLMLARPNAYELGDPWKMQLKYNYRYGSRLRAGVAMEKDAGELLLFGALSDTLRETVRKYRPPGFDFYGAHFYMTDGPCGIKELALGDYQLSFGQGMTLWTGLSFGKASGGSSVMKRAAGVRPKASAGEGKFFRGAATTLQYHTFQLTAFYSYRKIDATLTESDTLTDDLEEQELVSALQESGYHRTLGELMKRNTIRQQVWGGHLTYISPQLEIGATAYHVRLSSILEPKPSKYNQFFFRGDQLTNMGLDFRWQLPKTVFFGELSMSDNAAFAGLLGMTAKPAGYINFTLLYRNYGTRYQNLFLGAIKESSRGQAEEGYYIGLQLAPAPGWDVIAHADFFRFKWLTSQVYTPSWGQEYQLKVSHQISNDATIQLRFKSKTKMKNSADDHVFSHRPIFYTKRTYQLHVNYAVLGNLQLSNKLSFAQYASDDCINSHGYLVSQDIAYKPRGKPYYLSLRYALFESDDYNSRISIYENDVWGSFSIPSLSGMGTRIYLLGKINLFGCLSLYSRIGITILQEKTKTDLKMEIIGKF